MNKLLSIVALAAVAPLTALAQSFGVISGGRPAEICVSVRADKGVLRAVNSLAGDIEMVCGRRPAIVNKLDASRGQIVISQYGDEFFKASGVEDVALKDSAEKHILRVEPSRVVIAGADKRGAIYGIYSLSERLGVSPWVWWADVPVQKRSDLALECGESTDGCPKVKYRGIFINDEWPSFGWWCLDKFGGVNHKAYEHVFELLLRLKANFMWPAMWASAFYDDDKENGPLANEMGIIMGTSHHEPMALAQQDWKRRGVGAWNFKTNQENLEKFWRTGIERCKDWETIVTVGMRGDGDEPMGASTEIDLLTKIVNRQRKIIADVTGKKASKVPQVWALYKEVLDYYEKGMRVPDDITLLLCDDNWGNVRRLPDLNAKPRKGGYGMYYHVDYVGDPRNYKWLNVTQVERMWDQMELCYRHGVKEIWILNVGDIKPMEYPIQFFLDLAWNPEKMKASDIRRHTVDFCKTQFGAAHADDIADMIALYTKYNSRRTPEMLDDQTYSLDNYDEWKRVRDDYRELESRALRMGYMLPKEYADAYDELVLFPIVACANLYDMYYSVAMNKRLASKGDAGANVWADKVKSFYELDSLLTRHYNKEIAGGKWNHMMDQTHIGYTYWQQPEVQVMPAVAYVRTDSVSRSGTMLYVEGDGYVSFDAENPSRRSGDWTLVPNLGRTGSALTARSVTPSTWVEYDVEFSSNGEPKLQVVLSPTLNYAGNGHKLAVSIDGGTEHEIDVHGLYGGGDDYGGGQKTLSLNAGMGEGWVPINGALDEKTWRKWVGENAIIVGQKLEKVSAGRHTIRIRPVDDAMVLQKVMIDMGGLKPSYLGAPSTPVTLRE